MSTRINTQNPLIIIFEQLQEFILHFRVVDLLLLKKVCKSTYDIIRSNKCIQYRPENAIKLVFLERFNKCEKEREAGQYLWDHYIDRFDNVISGSLTLECLYLPLRNIVWNKNFKEYRLENIVKNELIANDIDIFGLNDVDELRFIKNDKCLIYNMDGVGDGTKLYYNTYSPISADGCDKNYIHPSDISFFQTTLMDDDFLQYRLCGISHRLCISTIHECDFHKIKYHDLKTLDRSKIADFNDLKSSSAKISIHIFGNVLKKDMTMKEFIDKTFDFDFLKAIATTKTFHVKNIMSVVLKKSKYNIQNQYIVDLLRKIIDSDKVLFKKDCDSENFPIIRHSTHDDSFLINVSSILILNLSCIKFLTKRLHQRHKKYTNRGFDCGLIIDAVVDIYNTIDSLKR